MTMWNPPDKLLKLQNILNKSMHICIFRNRANLRFIKDINVICTLILLKIDCSLRQMDGIFVFGKPATSVIAIGSNKFHIYRLSEALSAKGWNLNTLQFPCGIHICVTHMHTRPGLADQFLNDIKSELSTVLEAQNSLVEGKVIVKNQINRIINRFFMRC